MSRTHTSDSELAFIINNQLSGLFRIQSDNATNKQRTLSLQDLVNVVAHPTSANNVIILKNINQSIRYRTWYKMVLSTMSTLQSPAQAAASSHKENALERQGHGFELRVRPEENQSNQAYLTVTLSLLSASQKKRGIFLHCLLDEQFYLLHVTQADENRFQSILSTTSDAYKALMDSESHLYIT